ncbi:hypothetical protein AtEden1_Chr1g0066461 [Arabidopsis thaliana]
MDSEVIKLISQILKLFSYTSSNPDSRMRSLISLFSQLISLINSMDLDSQPEPEPESGIIFLYTNSFLSGDLYQVRNLRGRSYHS